MSLACESGVGVPPPIAEFFAELEVCDVLCEVVLDTGFCSNSVGSMLPSGWCFSHNAASVFPKKSKVDAGSSTPTSRPSAPGGARSSPASSHSSAALVAMSALLKQASY
jgi:hypothetical protein